jgi:hypothetical protein
MLAGHSIDGITNLIDGFKKSYGVHHLAKEYQEYTQTISLAFVFGERKMTNFKISTNSMTEFIIKPEESLPLVSGNDDCAIFLFDATNPSDFLARSTSGTDD